jgi:ABC-type glutathione transport system ATPase component
MTVNKDIILKVANFSAGFEREGEILRAVDDISFELLKGETLGIVVNQAAARVLRPFL